MSATYNWAYRPGVANKYGFVINASADDVKPSNACYVALFGNDLTGNGSRKYPWKTVEKARSLSFNTNGFVIIGPGVYREYHTANVNQIKFVGDGDVVFDFSYYSNWTSANFGVNVFFYNIQFKGSGMSKIIEAVYVDCNITGAYPGTASNGLMDGSVRNILKDSLGKIPNMSSSTNGQNNNTFYNCNQLAVYVGTNGFVRENIYYKCNITVENLSVLANFQYCLFFQCNFKLTNGIGPLGAVYPYVPPGFNYYSDINILRADLVTAAAASSTIINSNPLLGCHIGDPLFNNPTIGDLTLAFNSPAKNLSYFGTFVGALSVAHSIKVREIEAEGSFEFATSTNLMIANDSITILNQSLDAQIDTKIIVNTTSRELSKLPIYGFNADRNGHYIDSINDLDTTTKVAGEVLNVPNPYIVEAGAVTYNGAVYQPGQRFTTVIGQTTFSTFADGVLREILETPQRHTIMARFSNGGALVTDGTPLTDGHYYYVVNGAATYNSITYFSGEIFKAIDNNPFNGLASVITAFTDEPFQHYEPGIKPTSNNLGNSRTGDIVRGNGDPFYERGGLGVKEFPITAKFIQLRFIIKVNNLRP